MWISSQNLKRPTSHEEEEGIPEYPEACVYRNKEDQNRRSHGTDSDQHTALLILNLNQRPVYPANKKKGDLEDCVILGLIQNTLHVHFVFKDVMGSLLPLSERPSFRPERNRYRNNPRRMQHTSEFGMGFYKIPKISKFH